MDIGQTIKDAACGEVRSRHNFNNFIDGAFRVAKHQQAGVHGFTQVVRRNVGCHTDRDTGGAVDQQLGEHCRKNGRLFLRAVIVRREIHCIFIKAAEHFGRKLLQANFGITHSSGAITVDRSEVALAVYQRITHGEVLSHTNDCFVCGRVTVRMVLTDHVTDHTSRLLMLCVPHIVQFEHRKEHTAVNRLQTVTHVRKSSAHDHAHSVIKVGALHFIFQRNRLSLVYLGTDQIPIGRIFTAGTGAASLFLAFACIAGFFSLILRCLRTGFVRNILFLLFFVFFVVVVVVSHLTDPSSCVRANGL